MHPVFEILPNVLSINTEKSNLFIEVSKSGISYTLENQSDKAFTGVSLYNFDKQNSPLELSAELNFLFTNSSLLNNSFAKITVFFSSPECIQVPKYLYKTEDKRKLIEFVYGDLFEQVLLADEVKGREIVNVYSIPLLLHNTIMEQFPAAQIIHQNTALIRSLPVMGDRLSVLFYPSTILVSLVKRGKLQIIQHFCYQSGEDVAWHLLNICAQYGVKGLPLNIGGLIDMKSNLYNELNKYFLTIERYTLPEGVEYDEGIRELPQHFFSPLFSAALCG